MSFISGRVIAKHQAYVIEPYEIIIAERITRVLDGEFERAEGFVYTDFFLDKAQASPITRIWIVQSASFGENAISSWNKARSSFIFKNPPYKI